MTIEPECEDAVRLFLGMSTQWRTVGLSGPGVAMVVRTGLDYAALPAVAAAIGLTRRALQAAFGGLQIIETEAVETMARAAIAAARRAA